MNLRFVLSSSNMSEWFSTIFSYMKKLEQTGEVSRAIHELSSARRSLVDPDEGSERDFFKRVIFNLFEDHRKNLTNSMVQERLMERFFHMASMPNMELWVSSLPPVIEQNKPESGIRMIDYFLIDGVRPFNIVDESRLVSDHDILPVDETVKTKPVVPKPLIQSPPVEFVTDAVMRLRDHVVNVLTTAVARDLAFSMGLPVHELQTKILQSLKDAGV